MSIATMVIGESGSGKSSSMRNMDPNQNLLIQAIKKPLPFKCSWAQVGKGNPAGNIYVSDTSSQIVEAMKRTHRPIIVVDDFQYVLANEFMRRTDERGYEKFTEIGKHAWDILKTASELAEHKRVYILAHSQTDDFGKTRAKTIGRMLDEKIVVEGMFSIVLRTQVQSGKYSFLTQNSGSDTTKSPIGLFDSDTIDNDLAFVDAQICNYYQLENAA